MRGVLFGDGFAGNYGGLLVRFVVGFDEVAVEQLIIQLLLAAFRYQLGQLVLPLRQTALQTYSLRPVSHGTGEHLVRLVAMLQARTAITVPLLIYSGLVRELELIIIIHLLFNIF